MSQQLINRSPDLKRLQDEGYEIEIRSSHLLIHSVPYVNTKGEVARGILVSDLTLTGEITTKPTSHIAYFIGDHPCDKDGKEIFPIKHESNTRPLAPELIINHSFSNKPPAGYNDYYEKMMRYIAIIAAPANYHDSTLSACTFNVIASKNDDSPFVYCDTASSRAGIGAISSKMALSKVAIIGLGGTGSYILDLIAKTPIKEIHLFDDDLFLQHNAFRSPGAASMDQLQRKISKVEYFKDIYSNIHNGITAHKKNITESDIYALAGFDFVFLCIDKASAKKSIIDYLLSSNTSFIDVGMGVHVIEETSELIGICRVTTSSKEKQDHIEKRVSFFDGQENDLYSHNIQIADLNAFNATLAVIKWKKLFGFYQDMENEYNTTYSINVNQMTSDDQI